MIRIILDLAVDAILILSVILLFGYIFKEGIGSIKNL